MTEQPSLHPERIRAALRELRRPYSCEDGTVRIEQDVLETCRAALELVRKGQLAVGLSSNTVDTVGAVLKAHSMASDLVRTLGALVRKK